MAPLHTRPALKRTRRLSANGTTEVHKFARPLLLAAILFSEGPLGVLGIFEDGLGGGAIGVPLYAMAGGYAISGRGPRWGDSPEVSWH
jgi:hypothetical protein